MVNVAIIEDELEVRNMVQRYLDHQLDFQCVLVSDSVGVFFELLNINITPHILLLDIMLHGQNSIQHLAKIKKMLPELKVIIFTTYRNRSFVNNAIQEGADGYYVKGDEPAKLLEILQLTLQGGSYLDPQVTTDLLESMRHAEFSLPKSPKPFNTSWKLTRREEQIATELLLGKTYKEIAKLSEISIDTIRHHVRNLYKKLGVHSKGQLLQKLK